MGKSEYKKIADAKMAAKRDILNGQTKNPLLVVFAPTKELSRNEFFQLLEGLLFLPNHIAVISNDEIPDAAKNPASKISWINAGGDKNQDVVDKYLLAADMVLVFEEHATNLKDIMGKGGVVIGYYKSPLLENYRPNEETGNSFTFNSMNLWDIFRALVRACETYVFPYDWQNIMRSALSINK